MPWKIKDTSYQRCAVAEKNLVALQHRSRGDCKIAISFIKKEDVELLGISYINEKGQQDEEGKKGFGRKKL